MVVALAETPAPRLGKALGRDPTEGPMEVAAGGGCGAAPPLLLSDSEQQCYSELFARCAGAASGGPGPGPPEATRVAPRHCHCGRRSSGRSVPSVAAATRDVAPGKSLRSFIPRGSVGTVSVEEWGRQRLFLGIWRAAVRAAKKGGCAAEDGGDALVPRDTSLLCSSSPPRPVLGCSLRSLRDSDAPVVPGGSTASQTQSLPCSGSDVCFGCSLL